MSRLVPNQYYGYFDYSLPSPVFYVVLIKPANSRMRDWIGSKNVKLVDMLCVDDYILGLNGFSVDWSKCNER